MRELRKYTTPLSAKDIIPYGKTADCPKEKRDIISAEAERRGLIAIFSSFTSDTFHFIDPRPAEYKSGFERIEDFYGWLEENHLIGQRIYEYNRSFGHVYDHCFQLMPAQSIKISEAWNRTREWKGKDPNAIYCYSFTYWDFYCENPHVRLTNDEAARLLQEHLDFLHEGNPKEHGKKAVRVEQGRYGWENEGTIVERIVVYDGDGSRGTFDFLKAYDSATLYLNKNLVRFSHANGYDYEINGEFNVLK